MYNEENVRVIIAVISWIVSDYMTYMTVHSSIHCVGSSKWFQKDFKFGVLAISLTLILYFFT